MAMLYLLLAIFCTTANEWISGMLSMRAKMLEQAVRQMLDRQPAPATAVSSAAAGAGTGSAPSPADSPAAAATPSAFLHRFYDHPLITGLMKDCKHPSYIPARSFAAVLMDL